MSSVSPLREVLDDVLTEMRTRRAQLLAGLTYVVLTAGGLYLFSSIGEDSGEQYDQVYRVTLTGVGVAILALGVLLGLVTLAVDRDVRRRATPGAPPRHLRSPHRIVVAMLVGVVLISAGLFALTRWS